MPCSKSHCSNSHCNNSHPQQQPKHALVRSTSAAAAAAAGCACLLPVACKPYHIEASYADLPGLQLLYRHCLAKS
jgi:hypothetical protein